MKIAVVGASGQLGSDLVGAFRSIGDDVVSLDHSDIDIVQMDLVRRLLSDVRPEIIINTAAMHHVEKCESDPVQAYAVNSIGARNLSIAAADLNSSLVHISTDYVFDGRKGSPYIEEDPPCPLNVYGNSKLAGEYFVRTIAPKHFVLRVSAIYGQHACRAKGGLNFVELMLKLARERGKVKVVTDEVVSPTFTADIARQIVTLSRTDAYGLKHATSEGSCSWFEFAREIFRLMDINVDLQPGAANDFPAKVPRPKNSVLENRALKRDGLNDFRPWQAGLQHYLQARAAVTQAAIV